MLCRFHLLQEFDEGKRSCRRRLAGHNKRRRKTRPEIAVGGSPIEDKVSSYLLLSLLGICANLNGKLCFESFKLASVKYLVNYSPY
jgi:hypothetical protein